MGFKEIDQVTAKELFDSGKRIVIYLKDPEEGFSGRKVRRMSPEGTFEEMVSFYTGAFGPPKFAKILQKKKGKEKK